MAVNMSNDRLRPETIAAHSLKSIDDATGAVVPPLYLSTTYARDENYKPKLKENYVRNGNPTLWHAENALAALEGGEEALLFSSGMAAITTLFETIAPGARIVAPTVMYYGTRDWLQRLESLGRIKLSLFDPAVPAALDRALSTPAEIIWIETPLNPTWDVIDIEAAAKAAHATGAILAVDATATAAVTTRPLALGADIVFHSVTKYLNGHSDVLGGVLITGKTDNRWKQIATLRTKIGMPLGPFDCWLLTRGVRTVFVRYRQASVNARARAPGAGGAMVTQVEEAPTAGAGTAHQCLAYEGKGGFDEAQRLCTGLKLIIPATSLGGVESLAEHRKAIEGPQSPVPDNLVRFSIGIENADDLIADIEQALERI